MLTFKQKIATFDFQANTRIRVGSNCYSILISAAALRSQFVRARTVVTDPVIEERKTHYFDQTHTTFHRHELRTK